jgi:hypothetical protein
VFEKLLDPAELLERGFFAHNDDGVFPDLCGILGSVPMDRVTTLISMI